LDWVDSTQFVIAGLVPATHENSQRNLSPGVFMGGRHKAGHDVNWVNPNQLQLSHHCASSGTAQEKSVCVVLLLKYVASWKKSIGVV
jgi:hypothetical protein